MRAAADVVLRIVGAVILVVAFSNFDTRAVVISCLGFGLVVYSIYAAIRTYIVADAQAAANTSNRAAIRFFVQQLREMDLDHKLDVKRLSQTLSETRAERDEAIQKIARMTVRPRVNGRLASAENAAAAAALRGAANPKV